MSVLDGWTFCPRCKAELVRGEDRVECRACGFVTYANPAPAVCTVCVDGQGRVLLARRKDPPYAGRWDLPGGFVGEHEHPLDALRRELREETGLEIEPGEFLGVWTDTYSEDESGRGILSLYWISRAREGDARPADDVTELRWFAPDELPPDEEIAFHIPDVLRAWQQHA